MFRFEIQDIDFSEKKSEPNIRTIENDSDFNNNSKNQSVRWNLIL